MENKNKFKNELKKTGTTRLCKPNSCCPVITKNEDNMTITDDFGGKVQFTFEQWEMFGSLFDERN